MLVKSTLTGVPLVVVIQNGEPVMLRVVMVGIVSASTKNLLVPILTEVLIPFVPGIPPRVVNGTINEALPPNTFKGAIVVGLETDTELLLKLPADVVRDQYSVELSWYRDASVVPAVEPVKASTLAVTVPVPVVGFTKEKGRNVVPFPTGNMYVLLVERFDCKVQITGPSIKDDAEPPVMALFEVPDNVKIFVPVVVRLPLNRNNVPEAVIGLVSETPEALLIDKLSAGLVFVRALPVYWAAAPLKV